tara:strand:- start:8 stop:313 length:306 start_codon:yes stop_codon:yes gene_type:complete
MNKKDIISKVTKTINFNEYLTNKKIKEISYQVIKSIDSHIDDIDKQITVAHDITMNIILTNYKIDSVEEKNILDSLVYTTIFTKIDGKNYDLDLKCKCFIS